MRDKNATSVVAMGGREVSDEESLISETAIRGFWRYYRQLMGDQVAADLPKEEKAWMHASSVSQ